MTSSGYTEGELLQMQQDAIRRVKQMQERAKVNLQAQQSDWNSPGQGQSQPTAPVLQVAPQGGQTQGQSQRGTQARGQSNQQWNSGSPVGQQRAPAQSPAPHPASGGGLSSLTSLLSGGSSPLSGLLGAVGGDRILILLLMVLLLGEESDQTLILALCYLLLFD